jgi:hypothetical protein
VNLETRATSVAARKTGCVIKGLLETKSDAPEDEEEVGRKICDGAISAFGAELDSPALLSAMMLVLAIALSTPCSLEMLAL